MAWYDDIEDEIIRREEWANHSTTISSFDEMVLDLEKEALSYTERNGFQPCIRRKEVIDIYFTETGDKRYNKSVINTQNVKWIYGYIRSHLRNYGMFTSDQDIKYILHDVSMAHYAAEKQDTIVTVQVSESLRHRIRKIA